MWAALLTGSNRKKSASALFFLAVDPKFGKSKRVYPFLSPFEVSHTGKDLSALAEKLKSLPGETRVVMEHTGYYHGTAQESSKGPVNRRN